MIVTPGVAVVVVVVVVFDTMETASAPEPVLTLPATSVAVALIECAPTASGVLVIDQFPALSTVAEPITVEPS